MLTMADARTDEELLLATDAESFGEFYRRHAEWVLSFLARRTSDPELAADLCAEVFAAALLARRRYKPDGRNRDGGTQATAWLYRIASNKLNDALRRHYADDRARRRMGMEPVIPTEDDLADIAALSEDVRVTSLLETLPTDQRAAVRARVIEEREYGEIAGSAGVSEAVARQRVSRGLSTLRRRMGGRS
jgi:RNA polymerase sigma-70 factor (ECF subfamily)